MNELKVKRIHAPAEPSDGARVLVDRLWPRGLTKEKAALTVWLKDLSPSNELRKAVHGMPEGEERWIAFTTTYAVELEGDAQQAAVAELRQLIAQGPVTLLFAASDEVRNNATALRDWLQKSPRP